ncbi:MULTISPECIES: hypothetical protein [Cysteiniphilum]|uniref:Uncharacterized protein n=1 Tax=Cysteiniphilum litorale TaxID=2056700 RepID=A0A8J2Z4X6_9GAMM|nr:MULTISPECIES: hypothetical protein [Cysteiniphilum]GGF98521.1 hypothetical protein GCM10010995_14720 [Cysteiniphilum litorale]
MLSSISSGLNRSQGLTINEKDFLPILDCYRGRDSESTVPITAGFEISDPKQTGYLWWRKLKIDLVNDVFNKKNMYSVSGRYLAAQTPVSSSVYCKYCVYLAEPLERYLRIVAKRANNYVKGAAPQRMWVAMENYGWMMDLASKNFDYNTLLSFLNRLKLWKRLTVRSNVTGTSPLGGGKGDCYKAFVELYDKGVRVFAKLNTHLLTRSYYSKFEAAKNVVTSVARLAESFTLSSTFLADKFINQFDQMCHVSTYKTSADKVDRVKAKLTDLKSIVRNEDLLYLYAVNNTEDQVDNFDDGISPYRKLLYLYDGMSKGGATKVDNTAFLKEASTFFSDGQASQQLEALNIVDNYAPSKHTQISRGNANVSKKKLQKIFTEKNEYVAYAIERVYNQVYPNRENINWDILHDTESYVKEKTITIKYAISKIDRTNNNDVGSQAVEKQITESKNELNKTISNDLKELNLVKENLSRYFSRFYWLKETHEEKIRTKFSSLSTLLKPVADNEGGESLEDRLKKLLKLYNETDVIVKDAVNQIETDLKAYIYNYTPNNTTHFKKGANFDVLMANVLNKFLDAKQKKKIYSDSEVSFRFGSNIITSDGRLHLELLANYLIVITKQIELLLQVPLLNFMLLIIQEYGDRIFAKAINIGSDQNLNLKKIESCFSELDTRIKKLMEDASKRMLVLGEDVGLIRNDGDKLLSSTNQGYEIAKSFERGLNRYGRISQEIAFQTKVRKQFANQGEDITIAKVREFFHNNSDEVQVSINEDYQYIGQFMEKLSRYADSDYHADYVDLDEASNDREVISKIRKTLDKHNRDTTTDYLASLNTLC